MAACPRCEHIFELDPVQLATLDPTCETVPWPADADAALQALPPPPVGIEVRAIPDGVELIIPWSSLVDRSFWNTMSILGGVMLLLTVFSGGGLFFLLLAVGYVWMLFDQNKSSIQIRSDQVVVEHGPLPTWDQDGVYTADELLTVNVKEWSQRIKPRLGGGYTTTHHNLATPHATLLWGWSKRHILDYVRALILAKINLPTDPAQRQQTGLRRRKPTIQDLIQSWIQS